GVQLGVLPAGGHGDGVALGQELLDDGPPQEPAAPGDERLHTRAAAHAASADRWIFALCLTSTGKRRWKSTCSMPVTRRRVSAIAGRRGPSTISTGRCVPRGPTPTRAQRAPPVCGRQRPSTWSV